MTPSDNKTQKGPNSGESDFCSTEVPNRTVARVTKDGPMARAAVTNIHHKSERLGRTLTMGQFAGATGPDNRVYWCPRHKKLTALHLGSIQVTPGQKLDNDLYLNYPGERVQSLIKTSPNPRLALSVLTNVMMAKSDSGRATLGLVKLDFFKATLHDVPYADATYAR